MPLEAGFHGERRYEANDPEGHRSRFAEPFTDSRARVATPRIPPTGARPAVVCPEPSSQPQAAGCPVAKPGAPMLAGRTGESVESLRPCQAVGLLPSGELFAPADAERAMSASHMAQRPPWPQAESQGPATVDLPARRKGREGR
jgi:hypothetical protein